MGMGADALDQPPSRSCTFLTVADFLVEGGVGAASVGLRGWSMMAAISLDRAYSSFI